LLPHETSWPSGRYKLHEKVCEGKTGTVSRLKSRFGSPTVEGEIFAFADGKLARITINIGNNDWEKVKYDLTEKLGPPVSEVPDVYQNAFGARREFNQGFWQKDDLVAYAGIKALTCGR
jgi:hypothetical protein